MGKASGSQPKYPPSSQYQIGCDISSAFKVKGYKDNRSRHSLMSCEAIRMKVNMLTTSSSSQLTILGLFGSEIRQHSLNASR